MVLPVTVYDDVWVNVVGAPGTGTFTIGTTLAGCKALSTIADGTQVSYVAGDGTNREISKGTVGGSGTTLTRGEDVISGTNGTSLVNFTASGVTVALNFSGKDFTDLLAKVQTIDGGTF